MARQPDSVHLRQSPHRPPLPFVQPAYPHGVKRASAGNERLLSGYHSVIAGLCSLHCNPSICSRPARISCTANARSRQNHDGTELCGKQRRGRQSSMILSGHDSVISGCGFAALCSLRLRASGRSTTCARRCASSRSNRGTEARRSRRLRNIYEPT